MAATAEQALARMGLSDQFADEFYEPLRRNSARAAHVAHPRYRTDVWIRCFDGAAYRFWLTLEQMAKLEDEFAYADAEGHRRSSGILRVFGAIAKGRYELDGKQVGFAAEGEASIRECHRIITEALIGGKCAYADGEFTTIDRSLARDLVQAHLACAPVEDSWSLAFAILNVIIHGRSHTEAEQGKPSSFVVSPSDDEVIELASSADVPADA